MINATGTKVVEYTYDAWGKVLTKTGSLASSLGTVQPFRYRGYVYDEETELYYLRGRYYKPQWNRFLNADILMKGNLYVYCNNSPVDYIDTDGKDSTHVNIKNVNVRTGPGTSYSIIKTISPDTEVTVCFCALGTSLNNSKNWYCVTWFESTGEYSGYYRQGYIHGSYLANTTPSSSHPSSKGEAFGSAVLKYGSKGIYVFNMQTVLYYNGYLNSLDDIDGVYGPVTMEALMLFQRDHVLPVSDDDPVVDGLVGIQTKDALWRRRFINGDPSEDCLQKNGVCIPNG